MTRRAISPRLAMSIFLNMLWVLWLWFYEEERLVVFHRGGIFHQHLDDLTRYFAFDLVKEFHGFDDTNHFAGIDLVAYIYKGRFIRCRAAIEGADHGALYSDGVAGRRFRCFRGFLCGDSGLRLGRGYGRRCHRGYRCGLYGAGDHLMNSGFFFLLDGQFESFLFDADFADV